MKLLDIVTQLQLVLPKYTDYFSETLPITSIVASGGVGTVVTSSAHGLLTGDAISLTNIEQDNPIDSVSQDGFVFTFTTTSDHDLTLGYPGYETVSFKGFTDTVWNNSFKLIDVVDRKTFKVQSTNSLPTLNTNEKLKEIRIDGINGYYSVTFVNTTTFTVSGTFFDGNYYNGFVKKSVRIAGSVTAQRAYDQYTKQDLNDLWMYVVTADGIVSKDRNVQNDSQVSIGVNSTLNLKVVDGFSLYVFANTKNELTATTAVDIARHELLSPILKSVFGVKFDTGLVASGNSRTMFLGHFLDSYEKAYLVYRYDFEFVYDVINEDASTEQDTKAFSKVKYTHSIGGEDVTDMTVDVNLTE